MLNRKLFHFIHENIPTFMFFLFLRYPDPAVPWQFDGMTVTYHQIPQTYLYVKLNYPILIIELMCLLCKLWSCVASCLDGKSDLYLQNSVLPWKTWLLFWIFCFTIFYRSYRRLSLSKNDRAVVNKTVMLHKAHLSISPEHSCLCSHLVVPFGGWVEVRTVLD